jgi:hypothetical protein
MGVTRVAERAGRYMKYVTVLKVRHPRYVVKNNKCMIFMYISTPTMFIGSMLSIY